MVLEDPDIYQGVSDSIDEFLHFLETVESNFHQKLEMDLVDLKEFCDYFKSHISAVKGGRLDGFLKDLNKEVLN